MNQTMTPTFKPLLLAFAIGAAALLSGCAATKAAPDSTLFDFGAPSGPMRAGAAPLAALVVTDVTGPVALDSERMFYRLDYADPLQARTYANSRWSATPLQLITQRFKARIAQAGVKVLSATDASTGVPLLRVEVDDFTHSFDSAAHSRGLLLLRASVFQGPKLVDQKTFSRSTAAGADAAGGARALAASTDAVAADIVAWLATLPPRKE